ncbi:MAG: hypothetical protein ACYTGP_13135 [Planctomycetota bacterium]
MDRSGGMTAGLRIALLAIALGAGGCEASGRAERVGNYARAAQPVEAVDLYFEPVDRPHELLAYLTAEAKTRHFETVAEAEAAAYAKLRELAAREGGLAVIDIETRLLRDGEPVADPEQVPRLVPVDDLVVEATAKAVRWRRGRD